jgi:nucleoside-diphosphate-sugar epimerase
VRDARKAPPLQDLGATTRVANLGNPSDIAHAVRDQDVVINLAHDFRASARSNVRGFRNLVDACAAAQVSQFVHTSSIVVYDDWPGGDISEESPCSEAGSDYKNAKVAMEGILSERRSLSSIILQPTIVYGPGSWLWTELIVERLLSGTVILPDPCQGTCHAVFVDDVADALILAASRPGHVAERFIVSGPEPVTWQAFYEAYERKLGTRSIRSVAASQLESGSSGPTGLASIASNPLQLASWAPIRRVLDFMRRAMGESALQRIRSSIIGLKQKRGPMVYSPTPDELVLYRAQGRCRIEKAVTELGYSPTVTHDLGVERTTAYIEALESRFAGAGNNA